MPTDIRLREPLVVLIETVGTGPEATTRKVELRGDAAVKLADKIRAGLPAPPAPAQEPPPPVPAASRSSLDVVQSMTGETPRQMMAAQRAQNIWNEAHPVMPSHLCHEQQRQWCKDHRVDPPCGPSRKGLISQFFDMLEGG